MVLAFDFRCIVGAAHSRPLARSALGSLSEGAGSPNGLTEGVRCVDGIHTWFRTATMGRQVGDPYIPRIFYAFSIQRTARLRSLREAKSLPYMTYSIV